MYSFYKYIKINHICTKIRYKQSILKYTNLKLQIPNLSVFYSILIQY